MHIALKNVYKQIGTQVIFENITCEMEGGNIYGICGCNGAGKTMLLKIICGMVLPSRGSVFIDGKAIGRDIDFPPSVGMLIEDPGFINSYSGLKNLKILASIRRIIGENEIRALMEYFNLDPNNQKKVKSYSLGMKQKLGIINAFMEKPELILLDEPINALDDESAHQVMMTLRKSKSRGALIIIAYHDKEVFRSLIDQCYFINSRSLIEDRSLEDSVNGNAKWRNNES
jgi:ABC-2 type transport system ATP-binding protein